ncbi:MAG: ABC transporter ATP-binding protein/permease [Bacilli bacterium]|nr:ABC transporter ATP-binding protein/permease [Bacilli bacterium]
MKGKKPSFDKATNPKLAIKNLFKFLKPYYKYILIVVIFAIGSTIFSIVGPKVLGNATTEIFNGLIKKINGTGGINFDKIAHIAIILLSLYVISLIFSLVQGFIMNRVTQKCGYELRKRLTAKIKKLPMKYFDKETNGKVLSIITNDVDNLTQSFNQVSTQLITSIVTVIGIIIMMFSINVTMTFIALLILPAALIVIGGISKKSQKYFKAQQDYLANVNGNIEEMYGAHSVVKVFNAEEKMIGKFESNNDVLYETSWKSQFLSGLMHPIMNFIGNIGYALIAIIGGLFAIKGKITVGNIQSFIAYGRSYVQPLGQVAQIANMIQSMIASSERIFNFLNADEEIDDGKKKVPANLKGEVIFDHVKFGYDEKIIIKDFSLKVKPGQKVAIVGPTGAGKTTLVKLLMRFYDLNAGSILVDGIDIKDLKRNDLRKAFGMVLQDTWLFSGSIKDNLKYGNLNASDDEVIAAAKDAYVHHFIQTQPDAYDMLINEESNNVSGGQKQLLTIARAILADPKILILDEATSSVDTRTEVLIQKAMDKLMKGRTSFIIAHRLSTIKNADLILVVNDGEVVEQGKHNELLKKDGFYANLYNSQFTK